MIVFMPLQTNKSEIRISPDFIKLAETNQNYQITKIPNF